MFLSICLVLELPLTKIRWVVVAITIVEMLLPGKSWQTYVGFLYESMLGWRGVPDPQNVEVWKPSFVIGKDDLGGGGIKGDNEIQLERWCGWIYAMFTVILRVWALIS